MFQIGYFYLPRLPVTWDGGLGGHTLNKCQRYLNKFKVSMAIINILGTACVYNFLTWITVGRQEYNIGTAFLHLICTTIAYFVNTCVYLLSTHQEALKSFTEMLRLQKKLQGKKGSLRLLKSSVCYSSTKHMKMNVPLKASLQIETFVLPFC